MSITTSQDLIQPIEPKPEYCPACGQERSWKLCTNRFHDTWPTNTAPPESHPQAEAATPLTDAESRMICRWWDDETVTEDALFVRTDFAHDLELALAESRAETQRLRAVLVRQHKWHLDQTERSPVYFGDTIGQVNAEEYQDSELYQVTVAALTQPPAQEGKV